MIGFAGPKLVEQTIRQKLPKGFQTASRCMKHGMIDDIVPREELQGPHRAAARAISRRARPERVSRRDEAALRHGVRAAARRSRGQDRRASPPRPRRQPGLAAEIDALDDQIEQLRHDTYEHLSPWDRVQVSRHPERPKTQHYIEALFTDVVELHGDRALRRRRGHVRRTRHVRGSASGASRPPQGHQHQGEHPPQLRKPPSGGLSQGDARHGPRREVRSAHRELPRHGRSLPGPRGRGAGSGSGRSPSRSPSSQTSACRSCASASARVGAAERWPSASATGS